MWTLWHLARADLLDRGRGRRVVVAAVVLMALASLSLPQTGAGYLTLSVDGHRGVYTSAWVGTLVGLLNSALFALPAFFVVRDAVQRDLRSGVYPLIASSPVGTTTYVAGKVLGNSVLLSALALLVALFAGVVQLVRAEDVHVSLVALVLPTLVMAVPTMVLVSTVAVLFECLPGLRGTFGNAVYFAGFILVSGVTAPASSSASLDVFGVRAALDAMVGAARTVHPTSDGHVNFGVQLHSTPGGSFVWQDLSWWSASLAGRWPLLLVVAALVLLAGRAHGWEVGRRLPSSSKRDERPKAPVDPAPTSGSRPPSGGQRPVVMERGVRVAPRLLRAELRLQLLQLPPWWRVGTLALGVLVLAVPPGGLWQLAWVISWVWLLPLWSNLRLPGHGGAASVVLTTEHAWHARWSVVVPVGVLLTASVLLPGLVRSLLDAGGVTTLAWVTGATFVPVLSAALLSLGLPARAVHAAYLVLWYLGPVSGLPALDFLSIAGVEDAAPWWLAALLMGGVLLWPRRPRTRA